MSKTSNPEILQGSILRYLLKHTFMFFPGMLGLSTLSLVDVYFVQNQGEEALAMVSYGTPIFFVGMTFIGGLATGIIALLSPVLAQNKPLKVFQYSINSVGLNFLIGIMLCLTGILAHPLFESWLDLSAEREAILQAYMLPLYLLFLPMGWVIGVVSLMRARGETKLPAVIMLSVVVVNIVLDPILVNGYWGAPQLGVLGVVWASLIALILGAILAFILEKSLHTFRIFVSFSREGWSRIMKIAMPVSMTRSIFPMTGLLVVGLLKVYGEDVVSGYGTGYRLDIVMITFLMSLSGVWAPFVGQNLGADQIDRLKKGLRIAANVALVSGAVLAILLIIFRESIAHLLVADAPGTEAQLIQYLLFTPWGYAFSGILMLFNTTLNMLNRPLWATTGVIIHLVFLYIPMVLIAHHLENYILLWAAYPLATAMACLPTAWLVRRRIRELAN